MHIFLRNILNQCNVNGKEVKIQPYLPQKDCLINFFLRFLKIPPEKSIILLKS